MNNVTEPEDMTTARHSRPGLQRGAKGGAEGQPDGKGPGQGAGRLQSPLTPHPTSSDTTNTRDCEAS